MKLSEVVIPNTGIVDWVRSFDSGQRRDYGIEFLTEATIGEFTEIPTLRMYQLPLGVQPIRIEDTIRSIVDTDESIPANKREERINSRLKALRSNWRSETPKSITALDELRSNPNSLFFVDLLSPCSYDGGLPQVNGISYSCPFVRRLAYLTASLIIGGSNSRKYRGNIVPSEKNKAVLDEKLKGCVTDSYKDELKPYILKQCYTRILNLIGLHTGSMVDVDYQKLGTTYLENMLGWYDGLSEADQTHVMRVASEFVSAFENHRHRVSGFGSNKIVLPKFKKEETAIKFATLFRRMFELAYPIKNFSQTVAKPETYNDGRLYYSSVMIIH